jgi:ParB-like chromosome segregation protein Spo0J
MEHTLIIDPEFKALIPPLQPAELEQLENSLRGRGCLDPIKVWQGTNIIIDGHNRYEICTRRGIEFKVTEIRLTDRDTVKNFMILNQLGRRNLSPDVASLLRGKLYNAAKKEQHRPEKRGQNEPVTPMRTAETVAAQTGVSPATVKRDAKFAERVEALGIEAEVMAGKVRKREVKPAKPDVVLIPEPEEYDAEKEANRIMFSLQRVFDRIPVNEVRKVKWHLVEWLTKNLGN